MSPENVRFHVGEEMRLADSALKEAQALLDLDLAPGAASRIYYAVFHAARALLYSNGISPRSHEAVRSLFSEHFVRTGKMSKLQSKTLSDLEVLRLAGDTDSTFKQTIEQLRPELERARNFVEAARRISQA
jgi:uncharacterized protein